MSRSERVCQVAAEMVAVGTAVRVGTAVAAAEMVAVGTAAVAVTAVAAAVVAAAVMAGERRVIATGGQLAGQLVGGSAVALAVQLERVGLAVVREERNREGQWDATDGGEGE